MKKLFGLLPQKNSLAYLLVLLAAIVSGSLTGCGRTTRGCLGGTCAGKGVTPTAYSGPASMAPMSEVGSEDLVSPDFRVNGSTLGGMAVARSGSLGFVLDGGPNANE